MGIKRHRPEEIVTKFRLKLLARAAGASARGIGPPPKKWSTAIVSKRRIRNGEQTSQTRRNSDEVTAG